VVFKKYMATIFDFKTVDQYLLHELDARKRRNESYSLRAFARDLGLSASRLSELLNGKAGMSEKMATTIAEKLKMKPTEKKYWLDLVLVCAPRNEKIKSLAKDRLEEARKFSRIREMKEAQFRVIADWYHSAILEMLELKDFRQDPAWIGSQLGVSTSETVDAIIRLKKLGLLVEKEGRWQAQPEAYHTFSNTPSSAIQKFHQQILNKSIASIQNDSLQDRQIQSMIAAIPRSQLPHFEEKIKVFLQECWEETNGQEKNDLYAFSVQIIPVRRRTRET
jgi:uncharacterized protein (TIGR02147 family)